MMGFAKYNKLIALFLALGFMLSLGAPAWSDDGDILENGADEYGDEEELAAIYDLPFRCENPFQCESEDCSDRECSMLAQMEKVAGNSHLELYILENFEYIGKTFDYDDNYTEIPGKLKEEGIFAVRVLANDYVWWSNPINAAFDPVAGNREMQLNILSSPVVFRAGDPETFSTNTLYSNTRRSDSGPGNYTFVNACESIDRIENGARFNYNFPSRQTKVSMEVVLDNDSILVTVPIKKEEMEAQISGRGGSVMLELSLLNSFGAAPRGEDGYIVVADGSGAVINFDNGKTNAAQYSGQVYGRDYAVSQRFAPPVNQQVYLPVFGIVRDSGANALVAIAEKGDENAVIRAAVSRQGANATSYNVAWFDFTMRTEDAFYIGTDFTSIPIYETGHIKTGDIAVRYYPLAGEDLSYADVANTYRDYLADHKGVGQQINAESLNQTPMYMTLNGGTVKTHSIVGFPVDLQTAATTYSQAETIVQTLKNAGVENAVITYNDFTTSDIKRRISTSVQYSGMLGGKNGFNSLRRTVEQSGYVMYPGLGFMEFYESGGGYSFMRHSSREATLSRAIQQKYELAFGVPDTLATNSTILSPFFFEEVMDKIIASLRKEGINNISLDEATYMLYSDFSNARVRIAPSGMVGFNRRDTAEILTNGFGRMNEAGISIMAQSANAFALPYVSHVSNVPLTSSNYDIFDYDVPFYQIAISGLIPYSANPFNAAADLDRLTLLALSTATPIHYEFIYENPGEFSDSSYSKKFYASFHGWVDESIDKYKMFNDIIGDVVNERIVSYTWTSANESETVFESGKTITVNFAGSRVRVNGEPVDLNEYYVRTRGGGV